jgi:hypothetical protein
MLVVRCVAVYSIFLSYVDLIKQGACPHNLVHSVHVEIFNVKALEMVNDRSVSSHIGVTVYFFFNSQNPILQKRIGSHSIGQIIVNKLLVRLAKRGQHSYLDLFIIVKHILVCIIGIGNGKNVCCRVHHALD